MILRLLLAYLSREPVYRVVALQLTSTLAPLLRLSGVMSQYGSSCSHIFSALTPNITVECVSPLRPIPGPSLILGTWLRFLSVPSGKFRNRTSNWAQPLPSVSFLIHYSLIILLFCVVFGCFDATVSERPWNRIQVYVRIKQANSSAKMTRNYDVFIFILA